MVLGTERKPKPQDNPRSRGVYAISVVAELVGTGPQNLRLYEQKGLLEPGRTSGGTRRYSEADIARLHRITELLQQGLNLEGIRMVLDLETDNSRLQQQLPKRSRPQARQTTPDCGLSRAGPTDPLS